MYNGRSFVHMLLCSMSAHCLSNLLGEPESWKRAGQDYNHVETHDVDDCHDNGAVEIIVGDTHAI